MKKVLLYILVLWLLIPIGIYLLVSDLLKDDEE